MLVRKDLNRGLPRVNDGQSDIPVSRVETRRRTLRASRAQVPKNLEAAETKWKSRD